ncbi:hypothetical protein L1887_03540 [Cichorium endivia]|nr:hypothetical protein L1887_03540 [Cichorium endivia]
MGLRACFESVEGGMAEKHGVPNSQTQASVPETQYDADAGLQEVPVRDEEDSDDFWNNIPNDCWNHGNKKD